MTIKAVMIDVDGVLVVHPHPHGWSVDLERDLGVSAERLNTAFFQPHWNDIVHGRTPMRERLAPVLQEIAPHVTCDALTAYWFRNDAHVDEALLSELVAVRAAGIELHLATVQEPERADYLWNVLDFRSRFDGLHYAADLGFSKPDPDFYRLIEERSGFRPDDLFLVDDRSVNVDAAKARGWAAATWTGNDTLRSLLGTHLS